MSETIVVAGASNPTPTAIAFLAQSVALPIVVAVATYLVIDRLGEWRKRRMQSTLGCAVMDSLLEEVRTGIATMKAYTAAADDPDSLGPPTGRLPRAIWTDPTTVSDEVLLRILETSRGVTYPHFHPKDLRSHCKNYFVHMTANFDAVLATVLPGGSHQQDWRTTLKDFLAGEDRYLEAAERVEEMLVNAQKLLAENVRRPIPR